VITPRKEREQGGGVGEVEGTVFSFLFVLVMGGGGEGGGGGVVVAAAGDRAEGRGGRGCVCWGERRI